jgi:hypothetical protein
MGGRGANASRARIVLLAENRVLLGPCCSEIGFLSTGSVVTQG